MNPPLDFVVIGAPRCATTAIATYLASHPNIEVSSPKETHFFDAHYDEGAGILDECFLEKDRDRLRGEATPAYLVLPWVPERIAATVPNARLIAILRDPATRAFSHWWLLYSRGIEDLPFDAAIAANLDRIEHGPAITEEGWQDHVSMRSRGVAQRYRMYLDHGHYARGLERYFGLFDKDALRVVFTHELGADPEGVVRGLYDFVGADPSVGIEPPERINEALGSSGRSVMQVAKHSGITRLGPLLPDAVKQKVKKRLSKMGDKQQLNDEMRSWLQNHYHNSTEHLEELLDVDLSAWKAGS